MNTALDYLDFDYSEDEHGHGSFDAMASVLPAQVSTLHAELTRVLAWACDTFGEGCGPLDEGWDWEVAPRGEIDRSFARIHRVGAWHLPPGTDPPPACGGEGEPER